VRTQAQQNGGRFVTFQWMVDLSADETLTCETRAVMEEAVRSAGGRRHDDACVEFGCREDAARFSELMSGAVGVRARVVLRVAGEPVYFLPPSLRRTRP
jgi:hypothetical protein